GGGGGAGGARAPVASRREDGLRRPRLPPPHRGRARGGADRLRPRRGVATIACASVAQCRLRTGWGSLSVPNWRPDEVVSPARKIKCPFRHDLVNGAHRVDRRRVVVVFR